MNAAKETNELSIIILPTTNVNVEQSLKKKNLRTEDLLFKIYKYGQLTR